jgi:hypothetical protein
MDALIKLLQSDPNAANAFGALASAAAAFLALLVSVISVVISIWAARVQRRHNQLSVRPLAEVTVADYENSLRVKLRNNGSGPMIVKDVLINNGDRELRSLVEWMPPLPHGRYWTTFSHALVNRTLLPGAELVMLELTQYENEINFAECRNIVRDALAPLVVRVQYSDIYNDPMPQHQKALDWFGRKK